MEQGDEAKAIEYLEDLEINAAIFCDGRFPMYYAVELDLLQVADYLISRKALLDVQTLDGLTPLLIATMRSNSEMVEKLLLANKYP